MTRIVIVDDQDLARAGLRALLDSDPGLEVVAEACHGEQAIKACRERRPDVVLMDIRMPGVDGIEATRRIRADPELDAVRVLILTTFDNDDDVLEAIHLGAAGYLLKDTPAEELRRAVHAVAAGGNLLSPEITRRVMEHLAARPRRTPDPRLATLTEREVAVLARLAHGETNAEIAARLHISPATARTYVSRILTKLQARDRTELAVIALNAELG